MADSGLDLGGIINFEHVNIGIQDQGVSSIFFYEGLGLTRDPFMQVGKRNMWCNIGSQQFHLPVHGNEQLICGTVGIVVPSLSFLLSSLEKVKERLSSTLFSFDLVECAQHDYLPGISQYIAVSSPGGNKFYLFENNPKIDFRGSLGIPYIELFCHRDSAHKIAAYYKHYFGAHYSVEVHGTTTVAKIFVGVNQVFIFKESDPEKVIPYSGYHVCVYVNDFSTIFHKFHSDKLLYSYEGDVCETFEEAKRLRQFRVLRIVDTTQEGGYNSNNSNSKDVFHMEHEVRSMYHKSFLRPLVNRTGSVGIYCAQ